MGLELGWGTGDRQRTLPGAGETDSWESCPRHPHATPMLPGEKLDPLPDTFILQPPVFHPVSSHSGLEPPGSQGSSFQLGPVSQVGRGLKRP